MLKSLNANMFISNKEGKNFYFSYQIIVENKL